MAGVRTAGIGVAVVWVGALLTAAAPAGQAPAQVSVPTVDDAARYAAVIKQYCASCHNGRAATSATASGVVFDTIDLSSVGADAAMWERVVRKLRAGAMPPQGMPHPDATTQQALLSWLERRLDDAAKPANPGRPVIHRLNRTEYRNAIKDLLAVDIGDVAALLPADDSAYGFDTIADFLGVSQTLLERYLSAAGRISALAVGDKDVVPGSETYTARQDLSQDKHLDGMPFGTVGGIMANHTFPVDGDYVLQATLFRTNVDQTRGLELPHQIEMTVDGERVFLETIGGDAARQPWRRGRGGHGSGPAAVALRCHRRPPAGARAREGWSADRHRRVPAAIARGRPAQAPAVPQLVRHLRRDGNSAHRDDGRQGAVHRRRDRRYAEPCARVHVPAVDRRRRKSRAHGRS